MTSSTFTHLGRAHRAHRTLAARARTATIFALSAAAATSCMAGASKTPAPSQPDAAKPGIAMERADDTRRDIARLWSEIEDSSQRAGLPEALSPDLVERMSRRPVAEIRAQCERPDGFPDGSGPRCEDVCRLTDSICDNAERICKLAATLDGDAWARDRCDRAKAACSAAEDRCCGCA